ncbi:hypothetical protein QEZ54_14430 [Catellatospora sp. KI3]|uniref:hypothetical protein n=1 Tax=Catellatospora sp. KI3 TaxID=3041620 RepID=UPI00248285D9|nr:hypothetical protein [Catellatospora sp. KI3]MDI1462163.1 hypothetical protein [Catellatospora sp. KI3]
MERMSRLWAAVVAGFLSTMLVPAVAWAEESGVAELARKKRGIGSIFGGATLICCLVVVAVIVIGVVLVVRRKK